MSPTVDSALLSSLLNFLECVLTAAIPGKHDVADDASHLEGGSRKKHVECAFLFALIWSSGVTADNAGRAKYSAFVREIMESVDVLDDARYQGVTNALAVRGWKRPKFAEAEEGEFDGKVECGPPADGDLQDWCYERRQLSYMVQTLLTHGFRPLVCGPTGTGKSVCATKTLTAELDQDKFKPLQLGFSAKTTAEMTQGIIDGQLGKRRKGVFGPPMGQTALVFVDDLNMPEVETYGAQPPIELLRQLVVKATMATYRDAMRCLLPTPSKSHYTFNLRDFSRVIQGVLMQKPSDEFQDRAAVMRLWTHEALRVCGDIFREDFEESFGALKPEDAKEVNYATLRRLFFGEFMTPADEDERPYAEISDLKALQEKTDEYLASFNSNSKKPMDLVMFMFAIEHVSRISRILRMPGGNALLVGVGGSGRQSLSILATEMAGYALFRIEITKSYGMVEWREDLKTVLKEAGSGERPVVFLFSDTQINREAFVEDINNMLNSGEVPNIFPNDEKVAICEAVRPYAKEQFGRSAADMTPLQLYAYFIQRVKQYLHIVLAFSPIGSAFRDRLRLFPSLVNCCAIDWFTAWPGDSLLAVAEKFLADVQLDAVHGPHHRVTPAPYLELIVAFKGALGLQRDKVSGQRDRYKNGLGQLANAEKNVATMQQELTDLQPVLKQSQKDTDALMEEIEEKLPGVREQEEKVGAEAAVAQKEADEVQIQVDSVQADLDEALPALESAIQALNTIKPSDINEVKALAKPPATVKLVCEAVCVMLAEKPQRIPDPDDPSKRIMDYWGPSQKMLADKEFIARLKTYDKDNIAPKIIKSIRTSTWPRPTSRRGRRQGVVGRRGFVQVVAPKKESLAKAQASLAVTMGELDEKKASLKIVQDDLQKLQDNLEAAERKKEDLVNQVDLCGKKLVRAKQLIESLGGEKSKWGVFVEELTEAYEKLTGDVLVSAGLMAYLGPFTSTYRMKQMAEWVATCQELNIPCSAKPSLARTLGDPVLIRQWNIEGLPTDDFSIDNAIIVFNARRWPLMIDPQGQANKWIFKQGGVDSIRLGDSTIEYSEHFRFYICTKLRNPHYVPEISVKVTLLNFMITPQGLQDQLLGVVVAQERSDLEQKKNELVLEGAENKRKLKEIEDQILEILAGKGNILENESAIATLNQSKVTSDDIKGKQVVARRRRPRSTRRKGYTSVAYSTQVLFFCITDLNNIEPTYSYSLEWFINLFIRSIRNSEPPNDVPCSTTSAAISRIPSTRTTALPGPWEKLEGLKRLCVLRCIRPDKVVLGIQKFVISVMGEKFARRRRSTCRRATTSPCTSPLVFVLSPGSDPMGAVLQAAETLERAVAPISLGQGQGPVAEKLIEKAKTEGSWVVLQNCHLAQSFMGRFEELCEALSPDNAHENFRLWCTTYPSPIFPTSVLQNGVKMAIEPPKGLRANLVGSYSNAPLSGDGYLESCGKPESFRKLCYALCMFHALLQERRLYGPLGWNIPYGFNESDLLISMQQLFSFLDENDEVPFKALKYCIGECNYGGRVTDGKDRSTLNAILDRFFNNYVLTTGFPPVRLGGLRGARGDDAGGVRRAHRNVAARRGAGDLRLPRENANITKDTKETQFMFTTVLLTEGGGSGGGGGGNDAMISTTAHDILAKLPAAYDMEGAQVRYPVQWEQSMNTVLCQELQRFNNLTSVMKRSLVDVDKAVKGVVVMSGPLEKLGESLDLLARLEFLRLWLDDEPPPTYWISAFFFQHAFMTASKQNYSRAETIPIDAISLQFEMLPNTSYARPPKLGVYVYGFFFEGARWDKKAHRIAESEPKVLYTAAPLMHFLPKQTVHIQHPPSYLCPAHWIQRGVAMLSQLDD
ncbi:dynein light chain binding protein [Aureococcus anophagefferens]|nr:dynein light chain binding protein [Aureococcus anophagefferens]